VKAIRSSSGIGVYRAGDAHILGATYAAWLSKVTATPAIYSLGNTANAIQLLGADGGRQMFRRVAQYCAVLAGDYGGTATFGNDTAVAAIGDGVSWLQTAHGITGPFVLVGSSMGFLDVMAWAKQNAANVAGIVGVQPAVDLTTAWEDPAYTADINAAYGGAYSPAVDGPDHDPMQFVASLAAPIRTFYGDLDTLVTPQQQIDFAALGQDCVATSTGQYGHDAAQITASSEMPELHSFLAALA